MTYTERQLDEIDRLVAERVMGWHISILPTVGRQGERGEHPAWCPGPRRFIWAENWHPTRDRGQALMVFEHCPWMQLTHHERRSHHCYDAVEYHALDMDSHVSPFTPTPMLAICLAALKRAGAEVPEA